MKGDIMKKKTWKERWNAMHAPFPFLILFLITLPWALFVFQQPALYIQAKWAARSAIIFLFMSFLLYLCLLGIRKGKKGFFSSSRNKLVLFTRKFIQFHYPFAIFGFIWILLHIHWMTQLHPSTITMSTGIFTFAMLCFVLITGYLRKQRSSGRRRRIHRYASFLLVLSFFNSPLFYVIFVNSFILFLASSKSISI